MSLSLTLENQDFELSFATVRMYFPSLLRIFSGSLEIIEKRESWIQRLEWEKGCADYIIVWYCPRANLDSLNISADIVQQQSREVFWTIWYSHQYFLFHDDSKQNSVGRVKFLTMRYVLFTFGNNIFLVLFTSENIHIQNGR